MDSLSIYRYVKNEYWFLGTEMLSKLNSHCRSPLSINSMIQGAPHLLRPMQPTHINIHRRVTLSDRFFGGTDYRHQLEISAVLSEENFPSVSYFPIHFSRKIWLVMRIWRVLNFNWQNISADNIFRRTKFSAASQIFGSFVAEILSDKVNNFTVGYDCE